MRLTRPSAARFSLRSRRAPGQAGPAHRRPRGDRDPKARDDRLACCWSRSAAPARAPTTSRRAPCRRGSRPITRSCSAAARLDYDAVAETLRGDRPKGGGDRLDLTRSPISPMPRPGDARPVSFVFNGGPGAASVFLHLGALGPRIMETPGKRRGAEPAGSPRRQSRRPGCPSPTSSLSTRSAPASAAARARRKTRTSRSGTCTPIIASLGAVVRLWLTRHQRWASPVFLVGESYGGFRAAAMARTLAARCRRHGQRARADLAGARPVGAASGRARSARRRLFAAVLCRHRGRAALPPAAAISRRSSILPCPTIWSVWPVSRAGRRRAIRSSRRVAEIAGLPEDDRPPPSRPHPEPCLRPRDPARRGRGGQPLRRHDRPAGPAAGGQRARRPGAAAGRRRLRGGLQRLCRRRARLSHRPALSGAGAAMCRGNGTGRASARKAGPAWRCRRSKRRCSRIPAQRC